MNENATRYPIGTPGEPWGAEEYASWFEQQTIKRHYSEHVLDTIDRLREKFDVEQYGALSIDPDRYPLFVVRSRAWQNDLPSVLVTGGVHGYETSGVQGALRFLGTRAPDYAGRVNLVVAPCLSPWGYETINRWNPNAVDPNRSFRHGTDSEEAGSLMRCLEGMSVPFEVHIDLHETTDTDNTEFRPALAARNGTVQTNWNIPDGFYLVGDTEKPTPDFQRAIIQSVEQVTHIAPPDENGEIIGAPLEQWGVIHYAAVKLGLCMGVTSARWVTTTEVYPDSPLVDDENCIAAQVAAAEGAVEFMLQQRQ